MSYQFVLTSFGKDVYKGGNKPVMDKVLSKTFKTKKKAWDYVAKTLGSGQGHLFKLRKNTGRIKIDRKAQMKGKEYLVLKNVKPHTKIDYLEKRYKGRYEIIGDLDVIVRDKNKKKSKKNLHKFGRRMF